MTHELHGDRMETVGAIGEGEEGGGINKDGSVNSACGESHGFSYRCTSCSTLISVKPLAPTPGEREVSFPLTGDQGLPPRRR